MNPEETVIASKRSYGIVDKEREEAFEKSYGRKPGSFTDRKQW